MPLKKPNTKKAAAKTVKTSLRIREDLWRTAKAFAVQEGLELQDVVNAALERHLPRTVVVEVMDPGESKPRTVSVRVSGGR